MSAGMLVVRCKGIGRTRQWDQGAVPSDPVPFYRRPAEGWARRSQTCFYLGKRPSLRLVLRGYGLGNNPRRCWNKSDQMLCGSRGRPGGERRSAGSTHPLDSFLAVNRHVSHITRVEYPKYTSLPSETRKLVRAGISPIERVTRCHIVTQIPAP